MADSKKKLLVIQVAGFGYDFAQKSGMRGTSGLVFKPIQTVFPAVTCTAQATFKTGLNPTDHNMPGNGYLDRMMNKVFFWEQSASLVEGHRIWDEFRSHGGKVGLLFWQQSLGDSADFILSPAPIHKHHGGMIQSFYSKPEGLYEHLSAEIGWKFDLKDYWGPKASARASVWVEEATRALMTLHGFAPDICMTYLPGLDYDLQRYGPDSPQAMKVAEIVLEDLNQICATAQRNGYEVLIFGDYAIKKVNKAVFINRALVSANLMKTRRIEGMLYPDLHQSKAFAVVDHQVAHIYVREKSDMEDVEKVIKQIGGVEEVIGRDKKAGFGVDCDRCGDLVAIASEGAWFAYPWWKTLEEAPDYASHVDIHNKPGYDPCELFSDWLSFKINEDTSKIRGSHGRIGAGCEVAFATSIKLHKEPKNLKEMAEAVEVWLDN